MRKGCANVGKCKLNSKLEIGFSPGGRGANVQKKDCANVGKGGANVGKDGANVGKGAPRQARGRRGGQRCCKGQLRKYALNGC